MTLQRTSRPQQIVVLLENFTYPQDTRVRNEAEALAGAGHKVTVVAPRGPQQTAREQVRGVDVRRYRTVWANRSAWSYALEYGVAHAQLLGRSLSAILRGARTLHFNGPPDTLALAAVAMRIAGGKVVYDMHDSGPELLEAKFGSSAGSSVLRAAQRMAIGSADQVIVTNETQRELAHARSPRSKSPEVTVVRNGPRFAEFPDPPAGRPGELAAPKLVYVGTLDVQDGVLDLPEILGAPELATAHLTVVGEGAARAELVERCHSMGLDKRIAFTGQVPHEQVAGLIASADIALDPAPATELNEGSTMIKIAEYLGCGRPVVAFDLRETRRTAGDAALYAANGDRHEFVELIAGLAHDGERRLKLGRLARERALELSWERSEQTLIEVYERLG